LLAPLACGSRWEAAYFVVVRRRKTCLLVPSSRTALRQPGSARRRAIRGLIARCRSLRSLRFVLEIGDVNIEDPPTSSMLAARVTCDE
jgi:hypothetical protein